MNASSNKGTAPALRGGALRLPLASDEDLLTRRDVLRVMAAAVALGGGAGCRQPEEAIVPYVHPPADATADTPIFFATTMPVAGLVQGLLVKSVGGRPIKIEGNAEHPASLGATHVFAQAEILGLYDPDRSRAVTQREQLTNWPAAFAALREALQGAGDAGAGLRILSPRVVSPTLLAQSRALLAAYPRARWHRYDAIDRNGSREGAKLAFGRALDSYYRLSEARVVLTLDADLFCDDAAGVRYAHDFAATRNWNQAPPGSRLYALESSPSPTGACADHRLALAPSELMDFTRALAHELGVLPELPATVTPRWSRWLKPVSQDLLAHRGQSVVAAGIGCPPALHALAHRINHQLGNVGRSVMYIEPHDADAEAPETSLAALCDAMRSGDVRLLCILGGNPSFDAPADLGFAQALARVPHSFRLGLYADETSAACEWHLPEAHFLESWGDAVAYEGTASLVQPLIAPLYDGKTAHEIVAALIGDSQTNPYQIVRDHWQRWYAERPDFDRFWDGALQAGIIAGTASDPVAVAALAPSAADRGVEGTQGAAVPDGSIELVLRPDPSVWDGRFANNAWLQECPRPLTKITWDNAVLLSPASAKRLGIEQDEVVKLEYGGHSVEAPACLVPGHADATATVHLGYGRLRVGSVGDAVGFDAYALRTSAAPWGGSGLRLHATGQRHELARTQTHHRMEGRDLVQHMTLAQLDRRSAQSPVAHADRSLLPIAARGSHAWAMTIDLGACSGCNACVVACQAENNVPSVGKRQVLRQREMHWLRVDSYAEGGDEDPLLLQQVVLCMHCETAPCELVCPVGATVHDEEGLNEMVYNRCIGTRYCSNNCPYKVRRFNFLHYSKPRAETLVAANNPEVTVRGRGVMEKCTYCIQRIAAARIAAGIASRSIADGEVVTACQAACPSQAIVFGDLNDPQSRVAQNKRDRRNYALLDELDTRPRTTYLARVRNLNPDLSPGTEHRDDG
jgi:Fe-S-cluster-containing dehydrogenase component